MLSTVTLLHTHTVQMQEVRSSTTALARLCERLSAGCRWMVSGTPLFDGIDDLNGELHFLGVWPFSLRDAEDGFWVSRVWHRVACNAYGHAVLMGLAARRT
jgi:hypothetical protein